MKRPSKLFEDVCLERMRAEEARGLATMGRYGVQATMIDGKWTPIDSYPDFEGIINGGRQFVFEAKQCSKASLQIDDHKFHGRQLCHLKKRAKFGAITFILIDWPERSLKTRTDPKVTWAFPIHPDHPFWQAVDRGEIKAITREDCETHGVLCPWNTLPREKKPRPDVLTAIRALQESLAQ